MAGRPRFLVVDGYAREGREDLRAGGATTAGVLYERMLTKCAPGAEVDILYPADPGAALPAGARGSTCRRRSISLPRWTSSAATPALP